MGYKKDEEPKKCKWCGEECGNDYYILKETYITKEVEVSYVCSRCFGFIDVFGLFRKLKYYEEK